MLLEFCGSQGRLQKVWLGGERNELLEGRTIPTGKGSKED